MVSARSAIAWTPTALIPSREKSSSAASRIRSRGGSLATLLCLLALSMVAVLPLVGSGGALRRPTQCYGTDQSHTIPLGIVWD
ncbi:hypothetical protein GCM10023100_10920 [Actinocorallia cavernae]|uniref:Uncharacterized protein n=2 Tax=Actinomycetes TaxID=1760 RepID=A0ABP5ZRR1_9ACTN